MTGLPNTTVGLFTRVPTRPVNTVPATVRRAQTRAVGCVGTLRDDPLELELGRSACSRSPSSSSPTCVS